MDFVFVIYTCQKYLQKAEILYSLLKGRLNRCLLFIVYGDLNSDYDSKIIANKYIVLRIGDGYDNLANKTICLFRTINKIFPNTVGCFKCDDDIIPNIKHLNSHIEYLYNNQSVQYSGKRVDRVETYDTYHISRVESDEFRRPIWTPTCCHCPGPLYYLGQKAMHSLDGNVDFHLFEDIMIGMHMHVNGIHPDNVPFINGYDVIQKNVSFHNDEKLPFLFVILHGRLGNHLFQLCSAYGIAKNNNRKLVVIGDEFEVPSIVAPFLNDNGNVFYVCKNDIDYMNMPRYDETNELDPNINCFVHNPNIILSFQFQNVLLYGYFQNEKYFKNYKSDILGFLKNEEISTILNAKYEDLGSSYFIHVRRGDYVNHPLYVLDYDSYYKSAIFYILDKDPSAKFYIVSDDIEYCKTYSPFSTLNCIYVDNLNPTYTLYLMSLCTKGGICCNSSFSWWGSYMNDSDDKTVIMPKKWINLSKPIDVFYEGVIIV